MMQLLYGSRTWVGQAALLLLHQQHAAACSMTDDVVSTLHDLPVCLLRSLPYKLSKAAALRL